MCSIYSLDFKSIIWQTQDFPLRWGRRPKHIVGLWGPNPRLSCCFWWWPHDFYVDFENGSKILIWVLEVDPHPVGETATKTIYVLCRVRQCWLAHNLCKNSWWNLGCLRRSKFILEIFYLFFYGVFVIHITRTSRCPKLWIFEFPHSSKTFSNLKVLAAFQQFMRATL